MVVDATVAIAFADTDDEDHQRGEEIVRAIDHGALPTGVIVHEALVETLNSVNERKGHEKAVALLDRLEESANFRLPPARQATVGAGRAVFRQYPDLAMGDAMQVAFAKSESVEYLYSFDDDFDQVEGITRLNTANNPFG